MITTQNAGAEPLIETLVKHLGKPTTQYLFSAIFGVVPAKSDLLM
jgi:hypothetical protein